MRLSLKRENSPVFQTASEIHFGWKGIRGKFRYRMLNTFDGLTKCFRQTPLAVLMMWSEPKCLLTYYLCLTSVLGIIEKFKLKTIPMLTISRIGCAIAQAVSRRLPRFEPRSGHMGFVVDKVALRQVFSDYFGFPCQFSFHRLLHTHHHLPSGAGTVGQTVADVPNGLSLTPP
jgi:hypothetical protein